jgi:hypothetical protein
LKRERAPAESANFGGKLFSVFHILIGHDAVRALAGHSEGDCFGAGVSSAGDKGDFVLQSHRNDEASRCRVSYKKPPGVSNRRSAIE